MPVGRRNDFLMRLRSYVLSTRPSLWRSAAGTSIATATLLARRRHPLAAMGAAGGLVGIQLGSLARHALAHEAALRSKRDWHERDVLRRVASRTVSDRAHDPVFVVEQALEETALAPALRWPLDDALAELRQFADVYCADPASLAANLERPDGPLERFGVPEKVAWAPRRMRGPLVLAGRVLDDIRLLHTSEIEHAALVYTLSARALIVGFAPWLSRYSHVDSPLRRGRLAMAAWGAMTAWSASLVLVAPQVATVVLDRGAPGARARRILLSVEAPLALAGAVVEPSWPITTFAVGWTNYWQRPGPAFYPRRLVAFVAATLATQILGLHEEGTGTAAGAKECLAALTAIALIGDSYGAMGLLSAAQLLESLISETSREDRAAELARSVLARSAAAMRDLADRLEFVDGDGARRRAIEALNHEADYVSGITAAAPLELQRLIAGALPAGTTSFRVARPTFSSRDLRSSVLREQSDADLLSGALRHCHIEARRYGRSQVLTDVTIRDERLSVAIRNDIRPGVSSGTGVGRHLLRELVEALPGGRLDHPGATLKAGTWEGMWEVALSCDAQVLGKL
jgi:hypothetical protein